MTNKAVIKIKNLSTSINQQKILNNINLDIQKDEILGIVGESGCGKTTLLKNILLLQPITSGNIEVLGKNLAKISEKEAKTVQRRWGVLFQQSALFSSQTVFENVLFPLRTQTNLSHRLQNQLAYLKIALAGLSLKAAHKYPSELSGGMQRKAALARAIALDPELLFLDEPTTGLDPYSANELDQLILDLRKTLNLTIIMVTHDMDTLATATDRVTFLAKGKILATLPIQQLIDEDQPEIKEYFSGLRAERVRESYGSKS